MTNVYSCGKQSHTFTALEQKGVPNSKKMGTSHIGKLYMRHPCRNDAKDKRNPFAFQNDRNGIDCAAFHFRKHGCDICDIYACLSLKIARKQTTCEEGFRLFERIESSSFGNKNLGGNEESYA